MKIAIFANFRKDKVLAILPRLLSLLGEKNIEAVVTPEIEKHVDLSPFSLRSFPLDELGHHCDIALSFGGDGTILAAARHLSRAGIPILGVNLGRFGFLTEISVAELYEKLDDLIAGKFDVEDRIALEARVSGNDDVTNEYYMAFNDVVLSKGASARTLLIETYIGTEYLNTSHADGIIISTPTGSTAYSLSAGGPLLTPEMNAILITPICPHSLSQRPLVIPDNLHIKIKASSEMGEMLLSVDGRDVLSPSESHAIHVRKADHPVRLVKCAGNSFYQVLRTKLNWGELPIKNNHVGNKEDSGGEPTAS